MKILITAVIACLGLAAVSFGQTGPAAKPAAAAFPASATPNEIAKAALAAHGGDKLKKLKSLMVKGSADLTFNGQAIPGAFSTVVSGEKYYFEIVTAVQQLKQTFDGMQTHSSVPGIALPPVTSLGFPLLPRIGDAGYLIAALPDGKKRKGFRLTTPEGFYTDFIVDEKTGQVKSYESKWLGPGDRPITTSVDIDALLTVDGLLIPVKYSQQFDLGPITAYANFKAKEIKVNPPIEDNVFTIGK